MDRFGGFLGLEVWRNEHDEGEVIMVSRLRERDSFKRYMRSAEHRVSHDRIPPVADAAVRLEKLEHLTTYEVVAT